MKNILSLNSSPRNEFEYRRRRNGICSTNGVEPVECALEMICWPGRAFQRAKRSRGRDLAPSSSQRDDPPLPSPIVLSLFQSSSSFVCSR